MAIAFDAKSDGATFGPGLGPFSYTSQTVASGAILLLEVVFSTVSETVTGATFNGVSCDNSATVTANGWRSTLLWWLTPASGAHTIQITVSGSVTGAMRSTSYTGVDTAVTPVTNTGSSAGATSLTVAVTTTVANSWLMGLFENHTRQEFAGSGVTMRTDTTQGDGLFDSTTPTGATGSKSLTVDTGATSSPWSGIVIAFAPTAGGGGGVFVRSYYDMLHGRDVS